jgi:SAM-dependent methyltransferase
LNQAVDGEPYANERDDYVLGHSQREYQRLVLQARVWEPSTRLALERVGLAAGARALDVGCGPGEAMRLMAERVAATGSVVGLDLDANLGTVALDALRKRGPDVYRFVAGDIAQMESVTGAPFDLVFARLLLFHMHQPAQILQRLWQWVKPGGVLLVMDYDTTGIRSLPQHPAIERSLRLITDAFRRAGRDIEIGSRMPCLFDAAGIGAPDGCDVTSVILPAAPSTTMLRELLVSLRSLVIRSRLADVAALDNLDRELQLAGGSNGYLRWPDMVATWKHKRA